MENHRQSGDSIAGQINRKTLKENLSLPGERDESGHLCKIYVKFGSIPQKNNHAKPQRLFTLNYHLDVSKP